jgi:hypothetical protein
MVMSAYDEREIHDKFVELCDQGEGVDVENGDANPVEEWIEARKINDEDLSSYAHACAYKFLSRAMESGILDQYELEARFASAFQLGFEVAADRYLPEGMPPVMGGMMEFGRVLWVTPPCDPTCSQPRGWPEQDPEPSSRLT